MKHIKSEVKRVDPFGHQFEIELKDKDGFKVTVSKERIATMKEAREEMIRAERTYIK